MPTPPALPYDHDHENEIMLFAQTNFRNTTRKFGIKTDDRRRHVYVIGKTGMGKTTFLENMVVHDINAGHGLCFIDPHGDTAARFLDFIPSHRVNDVVYFNPADGDFPVGFNVLETDGSEDEKNLVTQGLLGVFKKIWGPEVFSARMENLMLYTVRALLDAPGSTLLGINRMYADEEYRKRVVSLVQDPLVKAFWVKEFANWDPKYRTEATAAIQNKVGQFLSSATIRNIVAQVKSTVNIREIMDTRKIFICNLAKGRVGEEASRLLGAMLITRLQMAAMERVDIPKESDRQDFYLYVDEFQNFATESFADILSEARKYRLNLIVAHQYIAQLDEKVAAAIFGNVGTIVAFRVGAADAAFMEQEFTPRFTPEDLVNLRKYDIYLKLMIDGAASQPFSATTLPQISLNMGSVEKVVKVSRERYATARQKIEEKVLQWSGIADSSAEVANEGMFGGGEGSEDESGLEEKLKELEASSPKISAPVKAAGDKKKKAQFEIACAVCGKIQGLNFEPDWSRPWLCKEDLEKKKAGTLPSMTLLPATATLQPGSAQPTQTTAPQPPQQPQQALPPIVIEPMTPPPIRPAAPMQPNRPRMAPPTPPPAARVSPTVIVPENVKPMSLSALTERKPQAPQQPPSTPPMQLKKPAPLTVPKFGATPVRKSPTPSASVAPPPVAEPPKEEKKTEEPRDDEPRGGTLLPGQVEKL